MEGQRPSLGRVCRNTMYSPVVSENGVVEQRARGPAAAKSRGMRVKSRKGPIIGY